MRKRCLYNAGFDLCFSFWRDVEGVLPEPKGERMSFADEGKFTVIALGLAVLSSQMAFLACRWHLMSACCRFQPCRVSQRLSLAVSLATTYLQ